MAVISFDLNGTLLDPGPGAELLQEAVQMAFVHTIVGEFLPLEDLLEAAGGRVPEVMPAFPDVRPALERLRGAGHRLVVLTNSTRSTGERHVERAGLADLFDEVRGVDEAEHFKPHPRAYELVRSDWHVAAHWWDILGAGAVGRRTVYVARRRPLPPTTRADVVVEDLAALDLPADEATR